MLKEVEQQAADAGGKAVGIQADITRLPDIAAVFASVPAHFGGPPELFVSSAFPTSVFVPTAQMTEEGYDSMFAAVRGTYFALQQAAMWAAELSCRGV